MSPEVRIGGADRYAPQAEQSCNSAYASRMSASCERRACGGFSNLEFALYEMTRPDKAAEALPPVPQTLVQGPPDKSDQRSDKQLVPLMRPPPP